jgi:hypothetical protein
MRQFLPGGASTPATRWRRRPICSSIWPANFQGGWSVHQRRHRTRRRQHGHGRITRAKLIDIQAGSSTLSFRYGGNAIDVPADTVIFVSQNMPNRSFVDALEGFAGKVVAVGDALSPRYLQTAIREAHMAARSIT